MITQILAWPNLLDAWNDVERASAAPGADRVSVARWRRTWEERLVALRRAVLANTYRPGPLIRYRLPKPGGYRTISCLTVTDKVLQRAALNILGALFEPTFLSCSYGYRRGRSTADALDAVRMWRDAGYRWLLDADIDACFDSLDHGVMLGLVRERVGDVITLRLLEQWLVQGSSARDRAVGLAMGAVISPLLCNITLHPLDAALTRAGYRVVRYADDFVVQCATRQEAEASMRCAAVALESLHLTLDPSKTSVTTFDVGFDFLGVHFHGDQYSYLRDGKRIVVRGELPEYLYAYGPGYE